MAWIRGDTPAEQKYFNYLERLRQSGVTNMLGAAPYLFQAFRELARDKARDIVWRWMAYHSDPERVLSEEPKPKRARKTTRKKDGL